MKKKLLFFKNSFVQTVTLLCLMGFIFSCNTNKKTESSQSDISINEKTKSSKEMKATSEKIEPVGPKPSWGPEITDEMLAIIEKYESFKAPALNTLKSKQARMQLTPADAVEALMKENNIKATASKIDTTGKEIPVQDGKVHVRIYSPINGNGPFPIIVYYHGGGWVIADLDTYHASAKSLAEQTGAVLVSVAYRQAPEYKFPTAHNDSYAAYEWVLKNASSIKGDPKQIVVVGESAGGNLAAAVSMMARDKKVAMPIHQVLIYPIAGYDMNTESYQKYANAKPLNKPMMEWFFNNYLTSPTAGETKLISLYNGDLSGMPSTTIITAQLDPLQSDGEKLSDKLKASGVPVTYKMYKGVTHEFFGMAPILPEASKAQMLVAGEIKKSLEKKVSKK
jgi:acetyl esterase/lipase